MNAQSNQRDAGQEPEYDVFLSHASEDKAWCEPFAERLRNSGVRVWFDKWRLQPGHNIDVEINKAIESSRKIIAVWSSRYFQKQWTQVEIFSRHHSDPLSEERPIIPVCIEPWGTLNVPPTLRPILSIDLSHPDDIDLRFQQVLESLDLPRRDSPAEPETDLERHDLAKGARGRRAHARGKRFEDEAAALYRLLGFTVTQDTKISGVQIDLRIEKREGGLTTQAVVECKDTRITAKERDQILAQQSVVAKGYPRLRWIALSSVGFTPDTRTALDAAGIDCTTYLELLRDLVPLDTYTDNLIAGYEEWVADEQNWNGEDLFIRPDVEIDVTYERISALAHFGQWLGDPRTKLVVVLGDLESSRSFLYVRTFGPGNYLALLPDGRFDGTRDALRYLCYTESAQLLYCRRTDRPILRSPGGARCSVQIQPPR